MILRDLRSAVGLLAVLSVWTTALPAWTADHDAGICAAGGAASGGSGGGGGAGGDGGDGSSGASAGASGGAAARAGSTGNTAATGSVGVGAVIRGVGIGAVGGSDSGSVVDASGDPSGTNSLQGAARPYSLRAIYFRREQFRSTADCLTAARGRQLPLEVCQ